MLMKIQDRFSMDSSQVSALLHISLRFRVGKFSATESELLDQ